MPRVWSYRVRPGVHVPQLWSSPGGSRRPRGSAPQIKPGGCRRSGGDRPRVDSDRIWCSTLGRFSHTMADRNDSFDWNRQYSRHGGRRNCDSCVGCHHRPRRGRRNLTGQIENRFNDRVRCAALASWIVYESLRSAVDAISIFNATGTGRASVGIGLWLVAMAAIGSLVGASGILIVSFRTRDTSL